MEEKLQLIKSSKTGSYRLGRPPPPPKNISTLFGPYSLRTVSSLPSSSRNTTRTGFETASSLSSKTCGATTNTVQVGGSRLESAYYAPSSRGTIETCICTSNNDTTTLASSRFGTTESSFPSSSRMTSRNCCSDSSSSNSNRTCGTTTTTTANTTQLGSSCLESSVYTVPSRRTTVGNCGNSENTSTNIPSKRTNQIGSSCLESISSSRRTVATSKRANQIENSGCLQNSSRISSRKTTRNCESIIKNESSTRTAALIRSYGMPSSVLTLPNRKKFVNFDCGSEFSVARKKRTRQSTRCNCNCKSLSSLSSCRAIGNCDSFLSVTSRAPPFRPIGNCELKKIRTKRRQERHISHGNFNWNCKRYVHCCPQPQPRKAPDTNFMADKNGRILFEPGNPWPWSNYLRDKWFAGRACGQRHIPPNIKNIPQFYKTPEPPAICGEDLNKCHCEELQDPEKDIDSSLTPIEQKILIGLKKLRKYRPPVIWILGHPHKSTVESKGIFCKKLAKALDFKYINMDTEIKNLVELPLDKPIRVCQPNLLGDNNNKPQKLTTELALRCRSNIMSCRLVMDEGIKLNPEGVLEMIKIIILQYDNSKGFVIDSFPCEEAEAKTFEALFYPMTFAIYIMSKNLETTDYNELGREYVHQEDIVSPMYFRRSAEYSEEAVHSLALKYKDKCLILQNGRTLGEEEVQLAVALIWKTLSKLAESATDTPNLANNTNYYPPCRNLDCDCCENPNPNLKEQMKILEEVHQVIREQQDKVRMKKQNCGNDLTQMSKWDLCNSFYENPDEEDDYYPEPSLATVGLTRSDSFYLEVYGQCNKGKVKPKSNSEIRIPVQQQKSIKYRPPPTVSIKSESEIDFETKSEITQTQRPVRNKHQQQPITKNNIKKKAPLTPIPNNRPLIQKKNPVVIQRQIPAKKIQLQNPIIKGPILTKKVAALTIKKTEIKPPVETDEEDEFDSSDDSVSLTPIPNNKPENTTIKKENPVIQKQIPAIKNIKPEPRINDLPTPIKKVAAALMIEKVDNKPVVESDEEDESESNSDDSGEEEEDNKKLEEPMDLMNAVPFPSLRKFLNPQPHHPKPESDLE